VGLLVLVTMVLIGGETKLGGRTSANGTQMFGGAAVCFPNLA